ncbi:MAG: cytidylyltransferase domain-containing protein [Candidatus Pristimantibacillus sp.]
MIYVIIQARMGSTRLPGKVMLHLSGKPVLWHMVERLKHSKLIDKIIIATSVEKENDSIRAFCQEHVIPCYSGSENDVLDRYYRAAKSNPVLPSDIIIRITADCPLIDPEVIDRTIAALQIDNADYASNVIIPTYPDGLDCEVMTFAVLEEMWTNAKLQSEREHVTLYIRNHKEQFKLVNVENDEDLSPLRWTLDEQRDFDLIKIIYDNLYTEDTLFLMNDVINLLKEYPDISSINVDISRNEGLTKSLENDEL